MDTKLIYLAAFALYCMGALCLKNSNLGLGSRSKSLERRLRRRLVGTFFLAAGTLVLGVAWLTHYLSNQ
jgi:hypothetical protein